MSSTRTVTIAGITSESNEVKVLELHGLDDEPLPPFSAGAHIDVHLPGGLVRQYSLCSDPADRRAYVIGVKREPLSRGGSAAIHDAIRIGDQIEISLPRNNFPLVPAGRHVLVAGGIGITPMLSMIHELRRSDAPFTLAYFARSRELAAFREPLEAPDLVGRVELLCGLDPEGTAAALRRALANPPAGTHLYMCGPEPFMRLVQEIAAQAGWPGDVVHLEHFGADLGALDRAQSGFEIELARSAVTYRIHEAETIIEVLAAHGIHVDVSCEQGVCGTCLTRVLAGTPDHRDVFLTDAEKEAGDRMTICVSRALGTKLVLDL